MKALVHRRYGSVSNLELGEVLELREVTAPQAGDGEVLVRVRATSMHADIWHVVSGRPYVLRLMGAGVLKPKPGAIPGTDVAGVVIAVGSGVSDFKEGDRVFGDVVSDFQWKHGGSYAEYVCVRANELAKMPDGVSFEEAATLPTSAMIALRCLRLAAGGLATGSRVLINGAGGSVGVFALQVAKAHGAEVTAVDCAAKLGRLRSLGADQVVDYQTQGVYELSQPYDVILDVASSLSFRVCRELLTPAGKYIFVGHDHFGRKGGAWFGSLPRAVGLMAASPFFRQLPRVQFNFDQKQLLLDLQKLLEQNKLVPQIERTYSLEEVAVAYRRMLAGDALGHLVITP